jgi:cytoskeletal protein CcmA (bactofilin family)
MWTKQAETDPSNVPTTQGRGFGVAPSSAAPTGRLNNPTARNLAGIGPGLEIKGRISGEEDLQIDGKVDGPISLPGQRLTVGRTGRVNSEITAREVIVFGNINGNLLAQDRVEIKKDASVTGDITTARISIEDGAHFKGRIEIDGGKLQAAADLTSVGASMVTEAN